MNESVFIDLFKLGLKPIPLIWDAEMKSATNHWIAHSEITDTNYTEATFSEWVKSIDTANGMALKLFSPFGCIDFDLKNTEDKTVFDLWLKGIASVDDSILSKVCIEKTRNAGYHVYIKYPKLKSKVGLAREVNGSEVIAIYTGGTLSYCSPTPGYEMVSNDFSDIEELTDDEFELLVSVANTFDKYVQLQSQKSNIVKEYPLEYENILFQFDSKCSDDVFSHILSSIGLEAATKYRTKQKDKFVPLLRIGSKASYSAKAYYGTKNLQLFTSSIPGFPSFNDRVDKDDTSWNLSPSRILYYKNDKDWILAIQELKMLCDSAEIELIEQQPVTNQPLITPDRLKFPYDIFPDEILNFINAQTIQHEYLAGAALGAISTLIGNAAQLQANNGYFVKPILYLTIVAPPGASKTPALKAIFKPLEMIDTFTYKEYVKEKQDYTEAYAIFKNQKKGDNINEPKKPIMRQLLIKDSTIEMVIKILSFNQMGCCVYADEFSGFMKRMNRYGDGDELQKWLELWSGSPILMQRISRDEDKVENPFCTIIGGIQPGVLDALSTSDNEHNGFYHRFLFLYPEPQLKQDWVKYEMPAALTQEYWGLIDKVNQHRSNLRTFQLTNEAELLYAEWFNNKNRKYNSAVTDNVKGIIAKYQDYCLRFSLIIEIMNNPDDFRNAVSVQSMERAIRLTEYFLGNMNKAMKILTPVNPADKLTGATAEFYKALPENFTALKAIEIGKELNIKEPTVRSFLLRWCDKKNTILSKLGQNKAVYYEKLF